MVANHSLLEISHAVNGPCPSDISGEPTVHACLGRVESILYAHEQLYARTNTGMVSNGHLTCTVFPPSIVSPPSQAVHDAPSGK